MWDWLNHNSGAGHFRYGQLAVDSRTHWHHLVVRPAHQIHRRDKPAAAFGDAAKLEIKREMYGSGRDERGFSYNASGNFTVTNKGNAPLKLKRIFVVVQRRKDEWKLDQNEYELEGYTNRVLLPEEELLESYIIEDAVEFNGDCIYGLHVVCSDLPELSRHEFFRHPDNGMRHAFVPPEKVGFFRTVQLKVRRLEAKLDQMAEYRSGDDSHTGK